MKLFLMTIATALAMQAANVTLKWTGPVGTYDVYRGVNACAPNTVFAKIATNVTSPYVDLAPPPGIYCYGVVVTVNGASSSLSGTAVGSASVLPDQPTVTVTVQPGGAIVTWTGPAGSYDVFRAPGACAPTSVFAKIAPGATSPFTDSGLTAGVYCYGVAVTVNGVTSVLSGPAIASATIPPGQPILTITIATGGARLDPTTPISTWSGTLVAPWTGAIIDGAGKTWPARIGRLNGQLCLTWQPIPGAPMTTCDLSTVTNLVAIIEAVPGLPAPTCLQQDLKYPTFPQYCGV